MAMRRTVATLRQLGPARKTRHGPSRSAAALVVGALVLAGIAACGSAGPAGGARTLTMLAPQDSRTLDPFRATNIAVSDEPRLAALYDPLLYIDPGDGKVKPHLAQALTSLDGGTRWLLKLRSGVRFSDGTAFDAQAVADNYRLHAEQQTQSVHAAYATGLQLQVTDPLTLEIRLPEPNPNFDRTVATQLTYIEAPSALKKGLDWAGAHPIGAGPFKLDSWTRGAQQVFVKNDRYWQRDKGLPKLDRFVVKPVPDNQQQLDTLRSGGADMVYASNKTTIDKAREDLQVTVQHDLGGQMISFNQAQPPFDDLRARRAVALALDSTTMAAALDGLAPATGYFNETSPFFDPSIRQPAHNADEAQRLFDELAAAGKPLSFTYLVPQNSASQRAAEYLQSRLSTFRNVTMRIQVMEIGAYVLKYAVHRDFQAMLYQQWVIDPEPETYQSFHSTSPGNFSAWKSTAADRALEAGRSSTDPAARKKAYSDLQRAIAAEVPFWTYAQSMVGPVTTKHVNGITLYNTGVAFMDRIAVS